VATATAVRAGQSLPSGRALDRLQFPLFRCVAACSARPVRQCFRMARRPVAGEPRPRRCGTHRHLSRHPRAAWRRAHPRRAADTSVVNNRHRPRSPADWSQSAKDWDQRQRSDTDLPLEIQPAGRRPSVVRHAGSVGGFPVEIPDEIPHSELLLCSILCPNLFF